MDDPVLISRRRFHSLAGSALALTASSALAQGPQSQLGTASTKHTPMLPTPRTIKCLNCDLNWARAGDKTRAATAADWANLDPQEYFDYHRRFGNNMLFFQAYNAAGFSYYPTKLGPVAPRRGVQLLPRLWNLSRQARMPFMAYMCVNYETGPESVAHRHPEWLIPGTSMFGPESGWTELLCQRLREFLSQFPVEWLAFDGFDYGGLCGDYPVKPAPYVEAPFREILGRAMPARAEEITPAERLKYKREVMARQFRAIRKAVKDTSPGTQIGFNVPFWRADDPLWQDHPMVKESEMLWTESTTKDVMDWVLRIRKPGQRVMVTFYGRPDQPGLCDPTTWRKWHAQGCDFFAYVWGNPPDFHPQPYCHEALKVIRKAFDEML